MSNSIKLNLQNQHKINNVFVVENECDLKTFRPTNKKNQKKIRAKYNLPLKSTIWIYCGSLTKRKNVSFLLDTWTKINKKGKNKNILILVGDGNLKNELFEKNKNNSTILFYGYQKTKQVLGLMRASNYYISASHAEGFPNAILEAQACGLPLVLSRINPHVS